MNVEQWLGNDNKLGVDIWQRKYRKGNETFDQWLDRVSGGDDAVRDAIKSKRFLFGGRILSNRGVTGTKVTYSNCYVVTPPEDNIESIYDSRKKLARTYSYGGGAGVDLSKLAPAGAKVHNQAEQTTGAVSFMQGYSQTTEEIGQRGRRGALMISLDCHHPDLLDFIDIKAKSDSVTKANISVRVTDDFMRAVENDDEWVMSFTREETGETITKTAKARDIFNKLCLNNWNWAEPGILFWDRIEQYNLLENNPEFEYAGTNPCVTGDTLIHTTHGVFPIKELVGQQPHVYCMDEDGNIAIRTASKVWLTRKDAQLVRVVTRRGELRCTPDHLIHTRNRGWVCASDLKYGDKITGMNRQMKGEIHVSVGLSGGKYVPEHRLIAGFYADIDGKDVHHKDGDTFHNTVDNLEILDHGAHSAITNTGRHIDVVRDEAGRYATKPIKAKRHSINQGVGVGTNWTVVGVEWLDGREDVYDMTVPGVHNFIANRMVVHNCAEEPLPAGGSCLLGSINLAEFVNDKCEFEWDDFYSTINVAIRALNDVLDEGLPLHPLQEQRDSVRDWRQIGLGVMGVADMLIKMHLRYDSDDAIEHCRDVSQALANHAMYVSASMAREHGKTYPKYEVGTLDTDFVRNNADSITYNAIEKYGLYNSQLLTVAPTGTLSTMLGVSGGIEPIFAKSYKRKTESLHDKTTYYDVLTPIYQQYADKHGLTVNDEFPSWFVDSSEINSIQRVKMQAAWQLGIDASISSTVNLPKSATVDDVANIYMEAWRHGLKGITIYRSGCMREGVLVVADENNVKENAAPSYCTNDDMLPRGYIVDCQNDLVGKKRKLQTGCGSLHVLAFFDPIDGNLREVYFNKGSTGGCVDADTEYFNGCEWKKISEYNPENYERVLQYHEDGSASLVYPIAYIVNDNVGTLNHIHNSTGLDMVVSNDHRMYLYKNYTKYMMGIRSKLTSEIVTFDEFMSGSKNRHVPTTFTMSAKGIPVNDNDIRLLVAVYADGTFDGNKIVINLKKDRKKIRLRHLLSNSDIGWTERNINNTEYTVFYIHPKPSIKQWFTDKQFTSKWYDCSDNQLSTVVDECVYWDGSVGDGNRLGTYFTSKKNEADFIQFALTRLGYRATISLNNGAETKSDSYRVRWTKNNVHGLSTATIENYKTTDGKSYCFSVPSGLLVLRRNGKIFITGNCANFMTGLSRMVSLLCRAGVDIMTIKDQLDSTGVCPSYATRRATHHDTSAGSCCPMAIGNALVDMWHEMQEGVNDDEDDMVDATDCASAVPSEQQVSNNGNNAVACPECGNELVFEGGCNICKNCGWSKCG